MEPSGMLYERYASNFCPYKWSGHRHRSLIVVTFMFSSSGITITLRTKFIHLETFIAYSVTFHHPQFHVRMLHYNTGSRALSSSFCCSITAIFPSRILVLYFKFSTKAIIPGDRNDDMMPIRNKEFFSVTNPSLASTFYLLCVFCRQIMWGYGGIMVIFGKCLQASMHGFRRRKTPAASLRHKHPNIGGIGFVVKTSAMSRVLTKYGALGSGT